MADEDARLAAVKAALEYIEPNMTVGLGSGRAVFALADAIGERFADAEITVVGASPDTEQRAADAGLKLAMLDDLGRIDIVLDGADEVDGQLGLIKGGGAALLREKMLCHAADRTVIFCQARKQVERLGDTRSLPVEIVTFGWTWTRRRILEFAPAAELRRNDDGSPVVTAESDYLLDVTIPEGDIREFAHALTDTLGVVEHGLFLDEAEVVILGDEDGTHRILTRPR